MTEIGETRKRTAQFARELELAATNDMVEKSIREYCARTKERMSVSAAASAAPSDAA
jgi:hypothetical protein